MPGGRLPRARSAAMQASRSPPARRPASSRAPTAHRPNRPDSVGQADGAVDDVEQLPDGDGRGPFGVGPLVAPAVGDDQVAPGGEEGVEEELTVLAAGITVSDPGVGGDEVIVVDVDLAGEDAVV